MSEFTVTVHFDRQDMDDPEGTAQDYAEKIFREKLGVEEINITNTYTHDVSAEHTTEMTVGLTGLLTEQDVRNAFFEGEFETEVSRNH